MTKVVNSDSSFDHKSIDIILSVENVSKKFARYIKLSMFYGILDIASELTGSRQPVNTLRRGEF